MTDRPTDRPAADRLSSDRGPVRPRGPARTLARGGVVGAVCVGVLALLGLTASAASAHSDDGKFELVSATPDGPASVVTVKLLYTDDDPVTDATVTVAGDDGTGATLTPVTLQAGTAEGEFTGTVDFPAPGTWNLRVTSVKPAAELTLTQEISADTQVTTEGSGGAADPSVPSTTVAGSTPTTVDSGVPEITAKDTSDTSDGGSSPVWWILGVVAAVVAVALGVLFVAKGRNQGPIE